MAPKSKALGKRARLARTRPRRESEGGKGWPSYLLWGLILIPLGFALRFCYKSQDDADVKAEMIKVVAEFPNYSAKKSYYHKLVERNHSAAFELSYSIGGPRRSNRFDVEKYLRVISELMAKDAQRDGEKEVHAYLAVFHEATKSAK